MHGHGFDASLDLYRKTIKRIRPLHLAVHRLMTHGVIPALERLKGFQTIPDDPFWFRLNLVTGRHEFETVQVVERLLRPGMTVLDIGAHAGYYARRCAEWVGPGGRVFAFEPHPRTFEVLRRNVARLGNVTPVRAAVAEREGVAELYDYLIMSASGSLHYDRDLLELQKARVGDADIAPRIRTDFPVETFTVRTVKVDGYLAGQGVARVDVVKMDIEGAEMHALRGMPATIAGSPGLALVMEYNPKALKAFGFEPEAALAETLGMGFARVQAIEPGGRLVDLTHDAAAVAQLTARLLDDMGVMNLLFTRES
ncbi:MAG: FkbM family methyltransferase [Anaerolineae bacterium]|nr:FkbM family methyltransferase [Anaerolineae bacterium]